MDALLITLPVIIGGTFSAFFITSVNSFMNTPNGFDFINGKLMNIDPIAAMFNASFGIRAFHVIATAFMTAAFILASIAAYRLIKNKFIDDKEYHKKLLNLQ